MEEPAPKARMPRARIKDGHMTEKSNPRAITQPTKRITKAKAERPVAKKHRPPPMEEQIDSGKKAAQARMRCKHSLRSAPKKTLAMASGHGALAMVTRQEASMGREQLGESL